MLAEPPNPSVLAWCLWLSKLRSATPQIQLIAFCGSNAGGRPPALRGLVSKRRKRPHLLGKLRKPVTMFPHSFPRLISYPANDCFGSKVDISETLVSCRAPTCREPLVVCCAERLSGGVKDDHQRFPHFCSSAEQLHWNASSDDHRVSCTAANYSFWRFQALLPL